jgi:hypothetical protein
VLDLADDDAPLGQLGAGGLDVGDDELQASTDPGGVSTIPVAMAIEQADPGGVSCTMWTSSLTRVSWSTAKPTCSL